MHALLYNGLAQDRIEKGGVAASPFFHDQTYLIALELDDLRQGKRHELRRTRGHAAGRSTFRR